MGRHHRRRGYARVMSRVDWRFEPRRPRRAAIGISATSPDSGVAALDVERLGWAPVGHAEPWDRSQPRLQRVAPLPMTPEMRAKAGDAPSAAVPTYRSRRQRWHPPRRDRAGKVHRTSHSRPDRFLEPATVALDGGISIRIVRRWCFDCETPATTTSNTLGSGRSTACMQIAIQLFHQFTPATVPV